MNKYRTHNCGELSLTDKEKEEVKQLQAMLQQRVMPTQPITDEQRKKANCYTLQKSSIFKVFIQSLITLSDSLTS